MSILIKGMKMPTNCDECPLLTKDGDYDVCFVGKQRVMWEWKYDRGSEVIHPKPDFCHLIEVPPHGRLIDADDIENITVIMNKNGVGFNRIVAPTVIPADKDGET